jgi:hypothetical protein
MEKIKKLRLEEQWILQSYTFTEWPGQTGNSDTGVPAQPLLPQSSSLEEKEGVTRLVTQQRCGG